MPEATTWIMNSRKSIEETLEVWQKTKKILLDNHDWDGCYAFTQLVRDKVKDAHMRGLFTGEEIAEIDKKYRIDVFLTLLSIPLKT